MVEVAGVERSALIPEASFYQYVKVLSVRGGHSYGHPILAWPVVYLSNSVSLNRVLGEGFCIAMVIS
jgi:hypothetical protein